MYRYRYIPVAQMSEAQRESKRLSNERYRAKNHVELAKAERARREKRPPPSHPQRPRLTSEERHARRKAQFLRAYHKHKEQRKVAWRQRWQERMASLSTEERIAFNLARNARRIQRRIQFPDRHKETQHKSNKNYRANHADRVATHSKMRRALKRSAPIRDLTHQQWLDIQASQDHRCAYCGNRAKGHLTQDHITSISAGGSHTLHNVIAACRSCNSRKGNRAILAPVQPLLL